MKNKIDLQEFDKFKKKIWIDYKKVVKVFSPALKSDIVFNSDGFHHLRYDSNRSERNKNVQRNKFIFLNDAISVLKKSTTIQEYRRSVCSVDRKDKSDFKKITTVEWFGFFAIINFSKRIRIKVIVRRVGFDNGLYHFWSVMPFWNLSRNGKIISLKEIEDK